MDENNDDDVFLDGEFSCRANMVGDIKELFYYVHKAYEFLRTCDENVKEYLTPVINATCDTACNHCYDLGFETPEEVDCSPYYCYVIRDLYEDDNKE